MIIIIARTIILIPHRHPRHSHPPHQQDQGHRHHQPEYQDYCTHFSHLNHYLFSYITILKVIIFFKRKSVAASSAHSFKAFWINLIQSYSNQVIKNNDQHNHSIFLWSPLWWWRWLWESFQPLALQAMLPKYVTVDCNFADDEDDDDRRITMIRLIRKMLFLFCDEKVPNNHKRFSSSSIIKSQGLFCAFHRKHSYYFHKQTDSDGEA